MKVNFIGLLLENEHLEFLWNKLKTEYLDYIDIPKCVESGCPLGVETEAHVTIGYNETFQKGPNWYYWYMFIKNKDLMNELREKKVLKVPRVTIDTFNRDDKDFKVLKFNMSDCNIIDILQQYHDKLEETAEVKSEYTKYNPHITLTYLKKSTPEEVIDRLRSELLLSNYSNWDMVGVKFSGENKYTFPLV